MLSLCIVHVKFKEGQVIYVYTVWWLVAANIQTQLHCQIYYRDTDIQKARCWGVNYCRQIQILISSEWDTKTLVWRKVFGQVEEQTHRHACRNLARQANIDACTEADRRANKHIRRHLDILKLKYTSRHATRRRTDRQIERQVDRQIYIWTDCQVALHTVSQPYRHTDIANTKTNVHIHMPIWWDRHADGQTQTGRRRGRQAGRKEGRTDGWTDTTDIYIQHALLKDRNTPRFRDDQVGPLADNDAHKGASVQRVFECFTLSICLQ